MDALKARDLVVIGGGIQGVTLALEPSRRGVSSLLLERGDFRDETTANSLRIVHGGLRYLQSLDLSRFWESVAERRWSLRGRLRRLAVLRLAAILSRLERATASPRAGFVSLAGERRAS